MAGKVVYVTESVHYKKEVQLLFGVLTRYFGLKTTTDLRDLETFFSETKVNIIGGTITSIFAGNPVADIDLYMEDPSKQEEIEKFLEGKCYQKEFVTDTAISFFRQVGTRVYHVQLILAFTGSPEQIFDSFDFTVCAGAYSFHRNDFVLHPRFLPDIAKKLLVYMGGSRYPICALYRVIKYQQKGYICKGSTIMHLALAVNALVIDNYKDLKKHLRGIDTLFMQGYLEKMCESDVPFEYANVIADLFECLDSGLSLAESQEEDLL